MRRGHGCVFLNAEAICEMWLRFLLRICRGHGCVFLNTENDLSPVRKVVVIDVGELCGKKALNPVRFPGTAFMQSTARTRFTFKRLLLLMTGVAIFPFPVVDRASEWYNAFAQDHDADFLLRGVTQVVRVWLRFLLRIRRDHECVSPVMVAFPIDS